MTRALACHLTYLCVGLVTRVTYTCTFDQMGYGEPHDELAEYHVY